ncbi:MAG: hypothetical protein IT303_10475 [Dehalococcoidia bacterium]|nr:hypothetical protein [Dehalococcoidia bacterium]
MSTERPPSPPADPGDRLAELTPRQRQVLDLIAQGKSNPQIADELGVTLDGAKHHVSEILGRLGFASRDEAAAWWRRRNGIAGMPARIRRRTRAILAVAATLGATAAGLVVVLALFGGNDDDGPSTSLPPGTWVAHIHVDPADYRSIRIRMENLQTGEERFLGPPAQYGGLSFAPDGSAIIASAMEGDDPRNLEVLLYRLPTDGSPAEEIRSDAFTPEMVPFLGMWPYRSPDGRYLAWHSATAVVINATTGRLVASAELVPLHVVIAGGYQAPNDPWGWSADSKWFTATFDGKSTVLGVDGSVQDLASAPPAAQPQPQTFDQQLFDIGEQVRASYPGDAVMMGGPEWSADGKAAFVTLMAGDSRDDRRLIVAVNGQFIEFPEVRNVNGVFTRGTYDAIVIE